jgi:hemolysin activation/secretion protein
LRALASCLLALLTHLPVAAVAQALPDPLLEQRRLDDLAARTTALGGFQPQGAAPTPGPPQARGGPCFQVERLDILGVTALPPAALTAITAQLVPGCLQGADIQAAMRAIDALYAERGLITSRTYIPPQNLASGTLTLEVIEGRVEGLYMIDDTRQLDGPRAQRQLATAFPRAQGALFDLRAFEQGLDQMNRLRSVDATLRLQPGDAPGGSVVIVQRQQADRFRGALRYDTLGASSTGRNRLSLDIAVDDLLGANDQWALSLSGTRNSNAASLSASIPWGAWTFGGDIGLSDYLTALSPLAELYGNSTATTLTARRMMHRDQTSTTELSFGLTRRHSDRSINATRLTPNRLTTLDMGLRHIRLGSRARNSLDATLTIGTGLLGATRDLPGAGADVPQAQFLRLAAGWQRQGALGTLGTLVTDLRLQLSQHPLYSSEQMSLGSYSTVRGYDAPIASGDSGAYLRSDLYLDHAVWTKALPDALQGAAATVQPHLFLDLGITRDHATGRDATAAGTGIGLSWQSGRVTASGLIAVPLIDTAQKARIGAPVIQIRLDIKTW